MFGCNKRERLTRELELLIAETESRTDPLMELVSRCPQAFEVGRAVERMMEVHHRRRGTPVLPPSGAVMIPFA